MRLRPELATLLEGVESVEAKERIIKAYHSLSGADPEGFAVQFAILGAAIATRIEMAVGAAHAAVEEAGKLDYNPDAVAQKVLKEVPSFRNMTQLAEALKVAVNHMDRGSNDGTRWRTVLLLLGIINLFLLAWLVIGRGR